MRPRRRTNLQILLALEDKRFLLKVTLQDDPLFYLHIKKYHSVVKFTVRKNPPSSKKQIRTKIPT